MVMSELVLNQMEDVGGPDELSQTKSEPTYLRRNRPGTSSKVSLPMQQLRHYR